MVGPRGCWRERAAIAPEGIARQTTDSFFHLFRKIRAKWSGQLLHAAGTTLKFTILGCAWRVPRPALGWASAIPAIPECRRRTSLLVERHACVGVSNVLVDTSPDLRERLIDARSIGLMPCSIPMSMPTIPMASMTCAGSCKRRRHVGVYLDRPPGDARPLRLLLQSPPGSEYPPIIERAPPGARQRVTVNGEGGAITALPVLQEHGDIPSLGFRFGGLAYSCDLSNLPPDSVAALAGVEVWIVDALRYRPHPSHFSVDDALAWIERIRPDRAILTNLHSDLDYDALRTKLPSNVEPAFDGLTIEVASDGQR